MFHAAAHRAVRCCLPILLLFPALSVRTALADVYTFQNFDYVWNVGPGFTIPQGINNSGQITGILDYNAAVVFIGRSDGTFSRVSLPEEIALYAEGINDLGDITGRLPYEHQHLRVHPIE